MKVKSFSKKLGLKKATVSHLQEEEMHVVHGGADTELVHKCPPTNTTIGTYITCCSSCTFTCNC